MQKTVINLSIAALFLSACHGAIDSDKNEIYSTLSPDGVVKARILQEGFNATVPDVSSIQISANDREPSEIYRADHVEGLKLQWDGVRTLNVQMSCGRIYHFSNIYNVLNKKGELLYRVNVHLKNSLLCPSDQ